MACRWIAQAPRVRAPPPGPSRVRSRYSAVNALITSCRHPSPPRSATGLEPRGGRLQQRYYLVLLRARAESHEVHLEEDTFQVRGRLCPVWGGGLEDRGFADAGNYGCIDRAGSDNDQH